MKRCTRLLRRERIEVRLVRVHQARWYADDSAETTAEEPQIPENADRQSLGPVDPVKKTIETAAGELPVSPLMDPSWQESRVRYQQRKLKETGRSKGRFLDLLSENTYARALDTPVRQCTVTRAVLPRFFMQDFNLVQHPDSEEVWWVPRSLTRSNAARKTKEADEAEEAEEADPNGSGSTISRSQTPEDGILGSQPPEKTRLGQSATETGAGHSKPAPLRQPQSVGQNTYALLRPELFSALTKGKQGILRGPPVIDSKLPSHLKSDTKWRSDMDTVLLQLMRQRVVEQLLLLASRDAGREPRNLFPFKSMHDIEKHVHPQACILWLGEAQERDDGDVNEGPGWFATWDAPDRQYNSKVAVHNLWTVLGKQNVETLRNQSELFRAAPWIVVTLRSGAKAQQWLWKIQGYLSQ